MKPFNYGQAMEVFQNCIFREKMGCDPRVWGRTRAPMREGLTVFFPISLVSLMDANCSKFCPNVNNRYCSTCKIKNDKYCITGIISL